MRDEFMKPEEALNKLDDSKLGKVEGFDHKKPTQDDDDELDAKEELGKLALQLNDESEDDDEDDDEEDDNAMVKKARSMKKDAKSLSMRRQLWSRYLSITSAYAQSLCEKLRLVLEPQIASRLKGDYRSGKRLNMKRIIPYIASGYRKDKIWLRRTKPSKRDYQV
jgi:midasin